MKKCIPLSEAIKDNRIILKQNQAFASSTGLYLPSEISTQFALIQRDGGINLFLYEEEYHLKNLSSRLGKHLDTKLLRRTLSDEVKSFYRTESLTKLVGNGYFDLEAVKNEKGEDAVHYEMLPRKRRL